MPSGTCADKVLIVAGSPPAWLALLRQAGATSGPHEQPDAKRELGEADERPVSASDRRVAMLSASPARRR
ncbi:Hypothetical protein A7982_01218 [Minicystis rosea]|nr:Hypothetical protein A7982_01218 [Minicystis rosea]